MVQIKSDNGELEDAPEDEFLNVKSEKKEGAKISHETNERVLDLIEERLRKFAGSG